MLKGRALSVAVTAGALAAAGAGGYLLSEARHGDLATPTTEAVVAAEPARPATTTAPVEPVAAPPTAAAAPARSGPAPQRKPDTPTAPATSAPPPAPDASAAAARATAGPEPAAPPAMTPSIPVMSGAVPVSGTAPVPLPDYELPVERIELVVERGSVLGVRLDEPVSSATARVEDRVTAVVTREVIADGRTAIPAGSRVEGHVRFVERGGKFRERARIGIAFTTLVLPASERVSIETEAIFREGESPAGEATSKIGASAVVGTVLGAVIGGRKGAAIGGAAGAAGGTAVVAAGGTNDAVLAAGTPLTLRLTEPVTIVVVREPSLR
jgi:hypothetical protein